MLAELIGEYETPLLEGHPVPLEPDYQDCEHCGLWFSPRGIDSHEENCPVKHSPYLSFDGTKIVGRRCPECGTWGGMHIGKCSKNGLSEDTLEKHPDLHRVPGY